MMKRSVLPRLIGVGVLVSSLAGCGWWSDDEDAFAPSELVDFDAEQHFDKLWSTSVSTGPGELYNQFAPAVDGDLIYVAGHEGDVVAINRDTGKKVWTRELDTKLTGGVGAGSGVVVVTADNGTVYALDSLGGQDLWQAQVASEVSAPAQINDRYVIVQVINGRIAAFDRATGEKDWIYDSQIPELSLRGTSTPLVTPQVTLAGFANGRLVAINNETGTALWEQRVSVADGRSEIERIIDIDGKPLFYNGLVFSSSYQGNLVAIDPRSARKVWSQPLSTYRSLASGFDNIYAVTSDDLVNAYDARTSTEVWHQDKLKYRQLTSPVSVGNEIVVGDREGYLHAMSQVDGHFVARYKFDSSGMFGDPLVVGDTLYVLSNDGEIAAFTLN